MQQTHTQTHTHTHTHKHTHTQTCPCRPTGPHPWGAVEDPRAETRGYPLGSLCDWDAMGGKDSRTVQQTFHI